MTVLEQRGIGRGQGTFFTGNDDLELDSSGGLELATSIDVVFVRGDEPGLDGDSVFETYRTTREASAAMNHVRATVIAYNHGNVASVQIQQPGGV